MQVEVFSNRLQQILEPVKNINRIGEFVINL